MDQQLLDPYLNKAAGSGGYDGYPSYEYGYEQSLGHHQSPCCRPVIDMVTLGVTIGLIGAATFFLRIVITMVIMMMRRKRSSNNDAHFFDQLLNILHGGKISDSQSVGSVFNN